MQNKTRFVLKKFVEWKDDFLHLIFPSTCLICENEISKYEKSVCSVCFNDLKFTQFENYHEETSLDKLFWGRVQLENTFSLLFFEKGTSTQKILHQIKYKANIDLAKEMGALLGEKLINSNIKTEQIDALIPVPLHPKKLYIRGYNQSEEITQGLSKVINVPINTNFLTRIQHAESQTRKGKFLRWDNIEEAFFVHLNQNEHLKHVAIVDDVITTGSTLESVIKKIKEANPSIKVSVISLSVTK
jgi:competence protein ComFC